MACNTLRDNNQSQNSGYILEITHCSGYGQQISETLKSFYNLLTHFLEYVIHYDCALWKTIEYLLFHPGKLMLEYPAGNRVRYLPRVQLDIL